MYCANRARLGDGRSVGLNRGATRQHILIEINGAILTSGDVTDVIDAYHMNKMRAGVRN